MASNGPQKSSLFYAEAHRAYIYETARGEPRTLLLFSIHDGKSLSWYTFLELAPQYIEAVLRDFDRGEEDEQSKWVFGHRIQPLMFKSRVPRRVNEFVEPRRQFEDTETLRARLGLKNWGNVSAQLASVRGNGLHQMTMTLLLSSGIERFNLVLRSRKPEARPAPQERGTVTLRGTEPFSVSRLNDSWRWRKQLRDM